MWEVLFEPYQSYKTSMIILEFLAFIFGVVSVYFAKQNNSLVYPVGIVSTSIYVYLLFQWQLLGDMIVNVYYSGISLMGWFFWVQKKDNQPAYPISKSSLEHWKQYALFFMSTITFVVVVYLIFDLYKTWHNYLDTFTTGLFFVAMFAMAKRRLEHWLFWIVGNVLSVPLYFYKGYTLTSLQYFVFLILAVLGYISWKKTYNKSQVKFSE